MTDESLYERLQMSLAILFFICIVYPIKYIVFPLTKILYENIYIIVCGFLIWVQFMIIGSPEEVSRALSESIIKNHITLEWIISPIITINGYDITILMVISVIIFLLILFKIYKVTSEMWGLIKTWFGHISMISLWGVYTILGNKEKSTMCLRS